MNTQNQASLTVEEAHKILKSFSCLKPKPVESESEKALIHEALLLFTSLSDYQNLGVCADTAAEGFMALESYLKALGYKPNFNQTQSTSFVGPVYIKFNSTRTSSYIDSYSGEYRGVLISFQSSENESINGTYGHLPLNLFASVES